MKPLAYRLRPRDFSEIVGQDHLIGEHGPIRIMLNSGNLCSFILYGKAGCGKTSIANIIYDMFPNKAFIFNASTDNKSLLKEIVDATHYFENVIVIIDEIHRMKKDMQDFLLPYLESGAIILIGLTTENPYRSINPAIRSRTHIYRMNEINGDDLKSLLKKSAQRIQLCDIPEDVFDYIVEASSLEIRTALNMLEIVSLLPAEERNLLYVKKIIGIKTISIDQNGENYYDILSALIKSIRGSDVDAALHYLARFLNCEDLVMITRRLMISAYEDIGFGNPQAGPQVYAACEAALQVGLPEARIPLGFAVILLASSPKSNSAYLGINNAIEDLSSLKSMSIPPHILNKEIKGGAKYLYPHDYPNDFVKQQYLPDEIFNHTYFIAKTNSKYERALKDYLEPINKVLKNK